MEIVSESEFFSLTGIVPLSKKVIINKGIKTANTLGKNVLFIIPAPEIRPLIQSMVVVTSPIGEKTPPAFAAMIIIPAKNLRSFAFNKILRTRVTIIIDDVILSNTADIKNVMNVICQSKTRTLFVFIRLVIKENPS